MNWVREKGMYCLAHDGVYWRSLLIWCRTYVFHIGWEILWPAEQLSLSQEEIKYQGVKFSPNSTTILSLKNKKFCRNYVWCVFISFIARCLLYLHLAETQFESLWRHFVAEYSRRFIQSLHTSIPNLSIYHSLVVLTFEPELLTASIINLKIKVNKLKLSLW